MPSKKRKFSSRFPPARIKKIMQTDEDVGKVAVAVPVIISRALEMFIESLIVKSAEATKSRNAKTLSSSHIKQIIVSEKKFDFLKDLVANVPDAPVGEEGETSGAVVAERKPVKASAPKQPAAAKPAAAATPGKRPRGRPRKVRPDEAPPKPVKRAKKEETSDEEEEEEEDTETESAGEETESDEEGGGMTVRLQASSQGSAGVLSQASTSYHGPHCGGGSQQSQSTPAADDQQLSGQHQPGQSSGYGGMDVPLSPSQSERGDSCQQDLHASTHLQPGPMQGHQQQVQSSPVAMQGPPLSADGTPCEPTASESQHSPAGLHGTQHSRGASSHGQQVQQTDAERHPVSVPSQNEDFQRKALESGRSSQNTGFETSQQSTVPDRSPARPETTFSQKLEKGEHPLSQLDKREHSFSHVDKKDHVLSPLAQAFAQTSAIAQAESKPLLTMSTGEPIKSQGELDTKPKSMETTGVHNDQKTFEEKKEAAFKVEATAENYSATVDSARGYDSVDTKPIRGEWTNQQAGPYFHKTENNQTAVGNALDKAEDALADRLRIDMASANALRSERESGRKLVDSIPVRVLGSADDACAQSPVKAMLSYKLKHGHLPHAVTTSSIPAPSTGHAEFREGEMVGHMAPSGASAMVQPEPRDRKATESSSVHHSRSQLTNPKQYTSAHVTSPNSSQSLPTSCLTALNSHLSPPSNFQSLRIPSSQVPGLMPPFQASKSRLPAPPALVPSSSVDSSPSAPRVSRPADQPPLEPPKQSHGDLFQAVTTGSYAAPPPLVTPPQVAPPRLDTRLLASHYPLPGQYLSPRQHHSPNHYPPVSSKHSASDAALDLTATKKRPEEVEDERRYPRDSGAHNPEQRAPHFSPVNTPMMHAALSGTEEPRRNTSHYGLSEARRHISSSGADDPRRLVQYPATDNPRMHIPHSQADVPTRNVPHSQADVPRKNIAHSTSDSSRRPMLPSSGNEPHARRDEDQQPKTSNQLFKNNNEERSVFSAKSTSNKGEKYDVCESKKEQWELRGMPAGMGFPPNISSAQMAAFAQQMQAMAAFNPHMLAAAGFPPGIAPYPGMPVPGFPVMPPHMGAMIPGAYTAGGAGYWPYPGLPLPQHTQPHSNGAIPRSSSKDRPSPPADRQTRD